jgi:hypothetical protein
MPKYLFDKYDGGFRNEIDEQGYRTIQLYQDIGKFPGEYERAKQWHFRRSIGMESIVHELMEVPNDFCPELQPVKITRKEVKHGSIRIEEFVDNHGRHTIPSKASKLLIKEFDDLGLTCVFEEERMLKKKSGVSFRVWPLYNFPYFRHGIRSPERRSIRFVRKRGRPG